MIHNQMIINQCHSGVYNLLLIFRNKYIIDIIELYLTIALIA